ncbi:hypothetical protein SCHPADRAFT_895388 [Schizopora paradoxa]|uniref:Uncharacterized protein n=1 Tax=Schizopora paradoxa TaxID=27342 RepID=A0A0H2R576_9AGAM|nr:hypothetical protein SCHPADRAFT_895388 [Schizopora paradoxa]
MPFHTLSTPPPEQARTCLELADHQLTCLLRFTDMASDYEEKYGEPPAAVLDLLAYTVDRIGLEHILSVVSTQTDPPADLGGPIRATTICVSAVFDELDGLLRRAPPKALYDWLDCIRHLVFSISLTEVLVHEHSAPDIHGRWAVSERMPTAELKNTPPSLLEDMAMIRPVRLTNKLLRQIVSQMHRQEGSASQAGRSILTGLPRPTAMWTSTLILPLVALFLFVVSGATSLIVLSRRNHVLRRAQR